LESVSVSCLNVSLHHEGISDKCQASCPMVIDLSWGFQPSFSSGTSSRNFRVVAISSSNSGSSDSLIFMEIFLQASWPMFETVDRQICHRMSYLNFLIARDFRAGVTPTDPGGRREPGPAKWPASHRER